MQKTLVTFVVLAVLMVAFFLIIEYTGDPSVPTSTGVGIDSIEASAVLLYSNA
ncbi:hypothetical protein [Lentibacillus sp. CBA3610]|uniref:hypothetical protein n=1 Tax=Lentibacillus sp. CBA3610 TaxID=2518176 RepID=UPI0015957FFF|nr:hypothetical protein [Lentibacillus sp. CBA3610]